MHVDASFMPLAPSRAQKIPLAFLCVSDGRLPTSVNPVQAVS
jgi:hypothetical protein